MWVGARLPRQGTFPAGLRDVPVPRVPREHPVASSGSLWNPGLSLGDGTSQSLTWEFLGCPACLLAGRVSPACVVLEGGTLAASASPRRVWSELREGEAACSQVHGALHSAGSTGLNVLTCYAEVGSVWQVLLSPSSSSQTSRQARDLLLVPRPARQAWRERPKATFLAQN